VKHQIQQAENPTPAIVNSVEAAPVDNAILLEYLTSEVALENPQIRSTDPNIRIDNNCMNDELHFGTLGASRNYEDEGDESDDADPNANEEKEASQANDGSTQNLQV
jgi:hypothetical protein